jgi:hypothetical protein
MEPSQVAGLDSEPLLNGRPVCACLLKLLQLFGGNGLAQPAQVHGQPLIGKVRHQDHVRTLLEQLDDLLVDVPIPDSMSEGVDARPQEPLRILERKDMGRDAEAVLVGLVDDGAIQGWAQLFVLAISVVDPDLDQVDLPGGQLLDGRPGLVFARDPVGRLGAPRLRRRDPTSCGARSRGVGDRFFPHLEGQIADIMAEAHRHADPVVGQMLQLINRFLSSLGQVLVGVDDRRHDGLAGQIHTRRARRNVELPSSADRGEPIIFNDECGVFDGIAAVPDNQPRPLEHRHGSRRRRLDRLRRRATRRQDESDRK